MGGGNEPGVRPRGRGGPGDGREPRRATGAGARGRRRGGGGASSAQPAVRAHRAGGEAPLGGEVARAEAGSVCRVRAGVGCCPGGPAGARAGRGGSRRGEAEDRDARREDRGAGGGAAASRGGSPAPEGGRRTARSGKAPRRREVEDEGEGSRNCARPPARGSGAVPRAPGRHRSEVERERQPRDDTRKRRCGPRRRRVGRAPSRALARRAVGRGRRRRYRQHLGKGAGRAGTADLDEALAPAEALRRRVSRLRELFATPGGDAALFTALEDRSPSWPRTAAPIDIERALGVAKRSRDRRQAASWEHRVVLEAEQQSPDVPSAAWRRTGERFDEFTDTGRPGRRVTQTLSDRARALAIAAERPEPPASPGLVKRLFEWLRERVRKMLHRLRPLQAAHRRDRSGGGGVEPARAAAAEQARQERRQARKLITAALAAARKWGDIPLATGTLVSVAESISARPGMSAAHRAVLEQIREAAPRSSLSTEAAALRRRCRAVKAAAADQRHQQALGEWEAQSWPRRRIAGRPRREHPAPPNRHDLAAARGQLAGVVRSAMITELEKAMPQPRPASPPADGARTPPAKAADRRDQHQVERPAEGQRHVPVRTPDTRPEPAPATSPPRSPAPRDRGHEPGR